MQPAANMGSVVTVRSRARHQHTATSLTRRERAAATTLHAMYKRKQLELEAHPEEQEEWGQSTPAQSLGGADSDRDLPSLPDDLLEEQPVPDASPCSECGPVHKLPPTDPQQLMMSDAMHARVLHALDAERERGVLMACFARHARVCAAPRITCTTWQATWEPWVAMDVTPQYLTVPGGPGVWVHIFSSGVSVLGAQDMADVISGLHVAQVWRGMGRGWRYTDLRVLSVTSTTSLDPPLAGAQFTFCQHIHLSTIDRIRLSGGASGGGACINLFRGTGQAVVCTSDFEGWFRAFQVLSQALSWNGRDL